MEIKVQPRSLRKFLRLQRSLAGSERKTLPSHEPQLPVENRTQVAPRAYQNQTRLATKPHNRHVTTETTAKTNNGIASLLFGGARFHFYNYFHFRPELI